MFKREEIIAMAREAGALVESWLTIPPKEGLFYLTPEQLEAFAAAIRTATKEEDARICEELASVYQPSSMCAESIRASK